MRPSTARPLPRFIKSINTLYSLFRCKDPPLVTVGTTNVQCLIYVFSIASNSGFGSTRYHANGIHYSVDTESQDDDSCSSNFREFTSTVETVEEEVQTGRLKILHLI